MDTNFEKKKFVRCLPENVVEHEKSHFERSQIYQCPLLKIYHFEKINVLPDSTLFQGIEPLELSFLFFQKRISHHNKKGVIAIRLFWNRDHLHSDKPFLIIHDCWTQNYYHWITQALPRLILTQQYHPSFVLLLPANHQSEFHITSLKLLGINSWQTLQCDKRYYTIKNLLYPTHDIQVGDYNDDLIHLLRDRLRQLSSVQPTKRLMIRRTSQEKRRIVNEEDVIHTFLSFNFEIVEFERISFKDQISLLAGANILAGVHGAGLTNMIFLPNQSKVFELTTKVNGENYYFFSLSNALSHKYYYQTCDTDREAEIQEANLIVDIERLKSNLELMLSQ